MTRHSSISRRLGRAATLFLVGCLVALPVSASAAPAGTDGAPVFANNGNGGGNGNDNANNGNGGGNGNDNANNGNGGGNGNGNANNGNGGGNGNGNANNGNGGGNGNANNGNGGGNASDAAPGNSGSAPGQNRIVVDPEAPGASGSAPGRTAESPGQAEPNGVAAGLGGAPPAVVPSGVTPTQGGLGALDLDTLPSHVGAAVVLFEDDSEPTPVVSVLSESTESTGLSTSVLDAIEPMVPPLLTDVVTSPLVVLQALVEAMAASGQALVIPFLAGAAGLLFPARRRALLDVALDPDATA